jgi:hypothetical protein
MEEEAVGIISCWPHGSDGRQEGYKGDGEMSNSFFKT